MRTRYGCAHSPCFLNSSNGVKIAEAVEGKGVPEGLDSGVGWNNHCKTNISYSSVLTTSDLLCPADRGRGMTKNGLALASEIIVS